MFALLIEADATAEYNGGERFAMQSVVKVPIGMAIIDRIAKGELSLGQMIRFEREELVPRGMRSPIRDTNPDGGSATVEELLKAAVSESDGTASDVLQRLAGGASGVQGYIDSLGVKGIRVKYSHKEFYREWDMQYENSITPRSAVDLLLKLWGQKGSAASGDDQKQPLLLTFMYETETGKNRLKGSLPAGTPVAHKTGTGAARGGVSSATNDIGIITMPDGRHIAIAVFVRDSPGEEKEREAVIADMAKAAWDHWAKN